MNKKQIIKKAAQEAGFTIKEEQLAIDAFLVAISDILKDGKEVIIPDFGRFSVYDRKERQVKHPVTGESVIVPAMKCVRFKAFGNIINYSMKYGK